MSNQLAKVPLIELVREIHQRKLTGALRLTQERQKVALYFDDGALYSAATNLRAFRLAHALVERRLCNPEQLAAAGGNTVSETQLATNLVAQNSLTSAQLDNERRWLVSAIFRHVSGWKTGEWEFAPRVRPAETANVALSLPALLLEPARRVEDSHIVAVLPPTVTVETDARFQVGDVNLSPLEGFVLSRMATPQTVAQISAAAGLPSEQVLRALYVLWVTGVVTVEPAPTALIDETRAAQVSARQYRTPEVAANVPASSDISGAGAEASSLLKVAPASQSSPLSGDQPLADPAQSLQAQLENFLFRLREAENYYQVLGIPPDADAREVKNAYHGLARSYHPDKFRALDATLHAAADQAFARATKAYHTLSNENLRAIYNRRIKMESAEVPAENAATVARETFSSAAERSSAASGDEQYRNGTDALRRGKIGAAIDALRIAVAQQPDRIPYRLQYARALSFDKSRLRDAVAEIERLMQDSGRSAEAHLLLAEVYQKSGMKLRARGEAEKALELEPANSEARALMHELRDAVLKK